MAANPVAKLNHDRLFGVRAARGRRETDPELIEYFGSFAFGEVYEHGSLDTRTQLLVILAGLIGCQAQTEYRILLGAALDNGITPVEVKEVVYHAIPYIGIEQVYDFGIIVNQVLADRGVELAAARAVHHDAGDAVREGLGGAGGHRRGRAAAAAPRDRAAPDTTHIQSGSRRTASATTTRAAGSTCRRESC